MNLMFKLINDKVHMTEYHATETIRTALIHYWFIKA